MIGTIRRHQQWLWGVIIFATIISFVTFLSPNRNQFGGRGSSGGSVDLGSVFGEPVKREDYFAAEREGRLFFRLRMGTWPDSEDQKKQVDAYAEQSLLMDAELKELKINPTTEAAARFTKMMMGVPPDQTMPMDKFQDFIQNDLMRKGQIGLEDFDRFVRHQCAQEYLSALIGMSGKLITSKEAEFFYRRENEPMATELVRFPATNYYAKTAPSDSELSDYYTRHQADYRVPDRIKVNYIRFDASNYVARAEKVLGTNLDDRADQIYHQQGPEAFLDADNKQLSTEAAIAKIKAQMHVFAELTEARKDVNAFLTELSEGHDDQHPYSTDDLAALAKTKGLTVKTTAAFDEKTGAKEWDVAPARLHSLFSLRLNDPDDKAKELLYAPSPLIGESAVYVAGLQDRIPSQIQALSVVYDRAIADYRRDKSIELAKEAGEKFAATLQAGMAQQDKTFDSICASGNVTPESLPPFALTSTNLPPQIPGKAQFQQIQEAAFRLPPDECSRFIATADGGFIVYLRQRLPVDEVKMKTELPVYLARRREDLQVAAFEMWLQRQVNLHLVPPPGARNTPAG
jgi:hypothetical protein